MATAATPTGQPHPHAFSRKGLRETFMITDRVLDTRIAAGDFPRADFYIGRSPRWHQATVLAYLESKRKHSKK
jgi:hypothetical protein